LDSGFYEFPLEPVRRDLAETKSKKKGLYRKRYAWLDDAADHTNMSMDELMGTKRSAEVAVADAYVDCEVMHFDFDKAA